eukprot:TRINITY_DN63692_c0_g1_i1.p1 TRINITY_DN63692_c0_g1~~TRINITY_DN63692_c0_g1_i1.p1  ORF type:complete len:212 (-),score=17.15 TRINITY_DN63692_c0_g1_i1:199-771(-)
MGNVVSEFCCTRVGGDHTRGGVSYGDSARLDKESDAEGSDEDNGASKVGCAYLIHDKANQGTLILHWSWSPVDDALAVLEPQANVPGHKFSTNGGRIELMRQANLGVHKDRFFDGCCQFVKAGWQYNSVLVVFTEEVLFHLHVRPAQFDAVESDCAVSLADADGVTCGPTSATDYVKVKSLPLVLFDPHA